MGRAGVGHFTSQILFQTSITVLTMLLSVTRIPSLVQQRITFSSVFLPKSLACNFSTSAIQTAKVPRMNQVEVDETTVQQKLGQINMDFVRKAERETKSGPLSTGSSGGRTGSSLGLALEL